MHHRDETELLELFHVFISLAISGNRLLLDFQAEILLLTPHDRMNLFSSVRPTKISSNVVVSRFTD